MVLHLREDEVDIETDGIYAEGLGACVFDGGSNMPELVIEDEPSVPSTLRQGSGQAPCSGQAHCLVHSPDINFSFFARDQPFNCFSRATACSSVGYSSK